MTSATAPHVCFVVESGTDARLVEGLAGRLPTHVLARAVAGGHAVSQPTDVSVTIAGSGRLRFAWRVFRTLMRRGPAPVILVQGYGLAAIAANIVSRLRGTPCWMLVCSPAAEYYEARRSAGESFSWLTLAGIHAAARLNGIIGRGFIVLSAHLRDVVRGYAPGVRLEVIPVYGVDVDRFVPRRDRAAARAERGLPLEGQIIFSSSRVAPEKDTATLLRAFAELVREGREVRLLHRSGGYRQFAEASARAGVAARVIATDAVDPRGALAADYAASDLCVQASRAEGLGFSALEALACGTAVVASAVGGLIETVRDGVTGWSVPPGDADALARAMRDALDRPQEAARRAETGRAMVCERFRNDAVFAQLADLLSRQQPR